MDSEFVDVCDVMRKCKKNILIRKTIQNTKPKQQMSSYTFGPYKNPITYNNRTMNYYVTARKCHIDPILDIEVEPSIAFEYPYQWDPYTGEKLGIDPYGPLYFHPASIAYYFYSKRLDGLWKNGEDTLDGVFEGYYDRFVGSGEDLEVIGRDKYPELYLFRLPILDCYLTPDHDRSVVTIGPKLTNDEIITLDKLCMLPEVHQFFVNNFKKACPSLQLLKKLYDLAIAKDTKLPQECVRKYEIPQYYYVDELKKI